MLNYLIAIRVHNRLERTIGINIIHVQTFIDSNTFELLVKTEKLSDDNFTGLKCSQLNCFLNHDLANNFHDTFPFSRNLVKTIGKIIIFFSSLLSSFSSITYFTALESRKIINRVVHILRNLRGGGVTK